jgi:hypothetical protein
MLNYPVVVVAAVVCVGASSLAFGQSAAQMTPTEKSAQAKLESLGYTQVSNVKSGPEGISAKAMKDGRTVTVVVDSSGKVKERP